MEREELLKMPEYWTSKAQLGLYAHAEDFMRANNMNRTKLAEYLGVTKGYITQLLNGEYDHKLSKFIDLALSFGFVPVVEFVPIEKAIQLDRQNYNLSTWKKFNYKTSTNIAIQRNITYSTNGYTYDGNKKAA